MKRTGRWWRILLWAVGAGLILQSLIGIDAQAYFGSDSAGADTRIQLRGATMAGWNAGHKQWEISADTVLVTSDLHRTVFYGVHGGALFLEGSPLVQIGASQVWIDTTGQKVTLSGDIWMALLGSGEVIHTSGLAWDNADQRLFSTGPVWTERRGARAAISQVVVDCRRRTMTMDSASLSGRL